MKHIACQKCRAAQERAGEALGLFNEASSALLDAEEALRDALDLCTSQERDDARNPDNLSRRASWIRKAERLLAHVGERQRVEAGIREIVAPS